jgi:hypothetical protein
VCTRACVRTVVRTRWSARTGWRNSASGRRQPLQVRTIIGHRRLPARGCSDQPMVRRPASTAPKPLAGKSWSSRRRHWLPPVHTASHPSAKTKGTMQRMAVLSASCSRFAIRRRLAPQPCSCTQTTTRSSVGSLHGMVRSYATVPQSTARPAPWSACFIDQRALSDPQSAALRQLPLTA